MEVNSLYMYILVNNDVKMGKGKIAGQVGHVVGLITEEIVQNYYIERTDSTIAPNTLTVVGFYPNVELKEKFNHLKLL
jgi:peptidyl-tRNA hydrolase